MRSNRPTVADLRAMKGKKQLSKIRVFTMEEVEAADDTHDAFPPRMECR